MHAQYVRFLGNGCIAPVSCFELKHSNSHDTCSLFLKENIGSLVGHCSILRLLGTWGGGDALFHCKKSAAIKSDQICLITSKFNPTNQLMDHLEHRLVLLLHNHSMIQLLGKYDCLLSLSWPSCDYLISFIFLRLRHLSVFVGSSGFKLTVCILCACNLHFLNFFFQFPFVSPTTSLRIWVGGGNTAQIIKAFQRKW